MHTTARRARLREVCLLFLLTVGLHPAALEAAQPSTEAFKSFYHQGWGVREGAPGSIVSITQSADGYLWLASPDGVWRFDGVRFARVTLANLPGSVSRLWALPDGSVWGAIQGGGAVSYRGGTASIFRPSDGFPAGRVLHVGPSGGDTVWVATAAGAFQLVGGSWQPLADDAGVVGAIAAVSGDAHGTVWMALADRLLWRAPGAARFEATHAEGRFTTLAASDGGVWSSGPGVGTGFVPNTRTQSPRGPRLPRHWPRLLPDRRGGLWLAGMTTVEYASAEEVARWRSEGTLPSLQTLTARDELTGEDTFDLFEDREGNIWIGTSGGLDLFRATALVPAALPPTMHGIRLAAGPDSSLWVGSQNHPLTRLSAVGLSTLPVPPSVTAVHAGRAGRVWVWNPQALWRIEGEQITRMPPAPVTTAAWSLAEDGRGRVWTAFNSGELYCLQDGVWTTPCVPGLPATAGRVRVAVADERGRVWLGYERNTVAVIDGDRAEAFSTADGLNVDSVTGLARSGPRTWVAGRGGLAVIDERGARAIAGLDNETVGRLTGVVEAADGSVWLNASRGIVRIDQADVLRMLATPSVAPRIRVFDYLDGVIGGAALVPPQAAVATPDGRLWFVGFNRVVSLDPAHLPTNPLPPPVHIQEIRAGGRTYGATDGLQLPVGTTQLEVSYTALSLAMPGRVRFRYQLSGVDDAPRDAGARRDAFYTNLGPGSYTFHVTASNNDGLWNDTGATLVFVVPPAVHQTVPFRAAVVVALAGLAWTGYRLRIRQVTAEVQGRLEARLSERERIARELHDTLLQGFQGLLLRFQAVASRLPPGEPAARLLDDALGRADRVLIEGRDRVTALRRTAEPSHDLAEALAAAGDELGCGDRLRVAVEGESRPLHPVVRDEAYWVVREALANAVQHARAGSITIEVGYRPDELRLRCRDDGLGMEADAVTIGGQGAHWGLRGMRERARRIGARLNLTSRPGGGTVVELRVPAVMAYRDDTPRWTARWLVARLGGARWLRRSES